ncbi:MAG TPA: dephospho-CoA kinase, partial [Kineosporiaceae bacterium]|nr:dephospho-CoA kinase [Kineosporiaceae bacterium]
APVQERVRRLMDDRGMSPQDAQARIDAQADDAARRAAADVWLENAGTAAGLLETVDALWDRRLVPFEANLRERRPAEAPARVVDPDPGWPAQAARLAARVARAVRAAGVTGFRVDHHGPTAIGRLPAQDVLDLQLVVTDPAAADGSAGALEQAGFIRVNRHRSGPHTEDFRRPDDPDDDQRLHAAADPGRPAHLQVRAAAESGWRAPLVLRDWLISRPDERDTSMVALRRALAWADRSGWAPGEPLASG